MGTSLGLNEIYFCRKFIMKKQNIPRFFVSEIIISQKILAGKVDNVAYIFLCIKLSKV